ncbi:MAG: ComEC/Rec2 family competence protein [Candidatus Ancillula sp.]|jgi:competence protein ComEC|nr:ComEC/Rec2 family competence protein [Candidatus Ancillula sp.]
MIKDFRLLLPATSLWIFLLIFFNVDTRTALVILLFLFGLLLVLVFSRRFSSAVLSQSIMCFLVVVVGFLGMNFQRVALFPTSLPDEVVVKIQSAPNLGNSFGKTRCTYQAESQSPHFFLSVETTDDDNCSLEYGAKYKLTGKYKADEFHKKNVANIQVASVQLVDIPNALDRFFNHIRSSFRDVIRQVNSPYAGFVLGMSVGDLRHIDKDMRSNANIAGLSHLTSISGTHFMIVISTVGGLLVLLCRKRKLNTFIQLVAVILMISLVQSGESVKRASFMAIIGLLGVFLGRRSQSLSALSFVVICWLLFDPWLSISYSFALSSVASASIILGTKPCTKFLEKYIGETLATLLAVPLVAQIGCSPILLIMNSYISPYSVLANIIAVPFASPVTILSLISCILAPLLPPLSLLVANIAAFFASVIANVANITSSLPFAKLPWVPGVLGILLFILLVLLFFLAPYLYRFLYSKITGFAPREVTGFPARNRAMVLKLKTRILKHRVISCVLIFCILGVSGGIYYGKTHLGMFSSVPNNWLIAACDVGQGDMGVVRTGAHSGVVIDVGPKNSGADSCLQTLGITKIDMLVLSHYHDDHVGDLANALKSRSVSMALLDPVKQPDYEVQEVDKILNTNGIAGQNAENGMRGEFGCTTSSPYCVKWQVISVYDNASADGSLVNQGQSLAKSTSGQKSAEEDDRENNSSIAMIFDVNGVTYFTAGDLEDNGNMGALRQLRAQNVEGVDVVKVSHHGSKTQSKPLINQLVPVIAIYMVGKNNYGHPNADTIKYFEQVGAKTLRTDTMGMCLVGLDADANIVTFNEK